ncbi:unnamed protein product [Peniophora sp. CBMAI 1063]|nr:unnamed protein product [Peniophora sp. CBMAI 1063]
MSNMTEVQLGEIADDVKWISAYCVFPLILESMLFALFTVLIAYHSLKYWEGRKRTRSIFAVCVCLYILCAICWALDVWIVWVDLYHVLPRQLSPATLDPASDPYATVDRLTGPMLFARHICTRIIFIMCDWVSLWRAYAIYGSPRWLKIACIMIVAVSCALYTVVTIFSATPKLNDPPAFAIRFLVFHGGVNMAFEYMSLSTTACAQIFATALIAWKAWIYRRDVAIPLSKRDATGSTDHKRLFTILCIVIETGILYTCLFITHVLSVAILLGAGYSTWSFFWISQLSGICPTLIVVVVSIQQSVLERSAQTDNAASDLTLSIQFAGNPRDQRLLGKCDCSFPKEILTPTHKRDNSVGSQSALSD